MQGFQTRRRFVATASLALAAPLARAQARYPDKPVTVVMPGTIGGSPDTMARLLALKLQAGMGQSVVVDTRRERHHRRAEVRARTGRRVHGALRV